MNEQVPSTRSTECLDDEIDLRELFLTLWREKWTILIAALVTAVVALGVSWFTPKRYET